MLKLRETEQNPDEERENEAAQEETGRTEGNEKDVEGDKGDEEVKEEDGRKEPEKDNKDVKMRAFSLEKHVGVPYFSMFKILSVVF